MKLIRILVLEDDLETLSKIFESLALLENKYADEKKGMEFSTTVLSESTQVEEIINRNPALNYDLILLDRDCKIGGSFHNIDIERFGPDKVVGISSVPEYNQDLYKKGVTKTITKDYQDLRAFSERLVDVIDNYLRPF